MEYINPRWRSYTIKGSSTPSCSLSAISIAKYGTVLGPATSPKGNSAVHNGLSARQQHDLMRQHLTLHHRLNTGRLLVQAASCRPFPDPVRVAAHLSQIRNKIRFSSAACKSQPGRVLGGHSNMGGGWPAVSRRPSQACVRTLLPRCPNVVRSRRCTRGMMFRRRLFFLLTYHAVSTPHKIRLQLFPTPCPMWYPRCPTQSTRALPVHASRPSGYGSDHNES